MASDTASPAIRPTNMPSMKPPAEFLRVAGMLLDFLTLHFLRRADSDERQAVGECLAHRCAEREPRGAQPLVFDEDTLGIIVAVELPREFAQIEGERMWGELPRRLGDHPGKICQFLRERRLPVALEQLEPRLAQVFRL